MSIKKANQFEKEGRLLEAFKENIITAKYYGLNEGISKFALANAQRIIEYLEKKLHTQALSFLEEEKIDIYNTISDQVENTKVSPTPLVTVVVPIYNAEKYLNATIESLKKQTYPNFEVILIDDFSKDNSPEIAKNTAKNDRRFRFYQHRANGGLASSRNSGIRLANGEYICFLDSDDLLAPESLSNRALCLRKYHFQEFIAGTYDQSITIPDNFKGSINSKEVTLKKNYVDFISAQGDCPFNANQPMLKRIALIALGGFPEKYPQAEDWRLWSKALRAGYVLIAVPTIGSGYRQTTNSMIRRNPLEHITKSKGNFFRAYQRHIDETESIDYKYEKNFYSMPIFEESVGIYMAKHKFVQRLFNFIGIELGRRTVAEEKFSATEAKNFICKMEPDFSLVFSGYSTGNAFGWISNGFKRYKGDSNLSESENLLISHFVQSTLEKLGVSDKYSLSVSNINLPFRYPIKNKTDLVDILFIPHKEYHTKTFELLLPLLDEIKFSYNFLDISVPYRDEQANKESISDHTLSYNEFCLSRIVPKIIVCMNDWDTVVKPIIAKAKACKIPTIGIVEGVQDYLDVDTGRKRNPYREVENIFLTGEFDSKYFKGTGQKLFPIGVQRLEGLNSYKTARLKRKPNPVPTVVLNVNFSYGVLEEKRMTWIQDVAKACNTLGYRLIISQHPQDFSDLSSYEVSVKPLYNLLLEADFFISRFSGAILEALVIGCPTIYYNGHNEKVDKFYNPLEAYDIANNIDELIAVLYQGGKVEHNTKKFLELHGGIGKEGSVIERTVSALRAILIKTRNNQSDYDAFKKLLVR